MTGLLPGPETTDTILEAFRPDTEPTRQQTSSPFVFGGTDPIDPRVLSGLTDALGTASDPGGAQAPRPQQPAGQPQQQRQDGELGELY
jgi:hypothetical protein